MEPGLCGAWDGTQGFVHTRWELYKLSFASRPLANLIYRSLWAQGPPGLQSKSQDSQGYYAEKSYLKWNKQTKQK